MPVLCSADKTSYMTNRTVIYIYIYIYIYIVVFFSCFQTSVYQTGQAENST